MTENTHAIRGLPSHAQFTEPELARIRDTTARFPVSRSWLYREAAAGRVRMVKLGNVTLVDIASLRALLANLPAATLRTPKDAA